MSKAAVIEAQGDTATANGNSLKQQQQQMCKDPLQQQKQKHDPHLLQLAAGFMSTVLWMFASSALIVINNTLYQGGFPYPMMVTGLGMFFSAGAGLLLSAVGAMPLSRGPPTSYQEAMRVLPLAACTAGTMWLGNAPYMYLSLSFIQILKAFTPALTLMVGVAARVERLTGALMLSVLLIAIGTGGAVFAESAAPTYNLTGILLFMGSATTEGGRVVLSQLLLGPYKYNSADVLVYMGLPCSALLITSSLIFERQKGLFAAFEAILSSNPWIFIKAGVMSSLVNLTSFLAISTTTSLTFKVSGCLKNLAVVWYGVVTHGDVVTGRHMLGYAVSLAGFVIYSYSRQSKGSVAPATAKVKAA